MGGMLKTKERVVNECRLISGYNEDKTMDVENGKVVTDERETEGSIDNLEFQGEILNRQGLEKHGGCGRSGPREKGDAISTSPGNEAT